LPENRTATRPEGKAAIFGQGERWRALKFLLVGLGNTVIGLSVIYLLKGLAAFGDGAANIGGYAVGLATSFTLNRNWTFRHPGAALPSALRFTAVFAAAYLANLGIVLTLVERFAVNGYVAQIMGIPPYTVIFYFGSRYFAFRASGV
jgi:putative flippase GtrA